MERLAYITELSQHLANAPSLLLNSLHPVFPLRGFEEWGYPVPDNAANSLDRVTLANRAIALTSILGYNRDLEEELSERLEDLFGIRIKFKLVPSKRGAIWAGGSEGRSRDTLFANKGTGANQVPFILVPIGLARPNETILLSEPEAHLHPKAQSELVSLLLKVAKKQNLQFFIETHSEHVLHKLLHAVAKGDLTRNDLTVYYFENPDGVPKARSLEINDQGQVEGGLPGFFEQS